MIRFDILLFLFVIFGSGILSPQTHASTLDQHTLGQAAELYYEQKYDESEAKLKLLPKTQTEQFPTSALEIGQILRSLNSIAKNKCADNTATEKQIKKTSIHGEDYEWIYALVIEQANCLLVNGHPDLAIKFIDNIYPTINRETTFTDEWDAALVRIAADGVRKYQGIVGEAEYVYEQAQRFDFSNQLKSEFYERSIKSFLQASLPEEALAVALRFEEELTASSDYWFRDYPLSQILVAESYADLELFSESEVAASKAFQSYLTLKTSTEVEYSYPEDPQKEIVLNFNEYLTLEDSYILNHLGLLLDRQWRFSEAVASYQLGIKIIEENYDQLEDYGFYFDIISNYSHTLSFMDGQEDKAKRYLENFFDSNTELMENYPLEQANLLNALAILYQNAGEFEKAEDTFIAGIDLLDKYQNHSLDLYEIRAQLLNNIGVIVSDKSEIEHYTIRAIEDLKALNSEPAALVQAYSNLGVLYLETDDTNKALSVLQQLSDIKNLNEYLSDSINFLNAILGHEINNEFLSEKVFEDIIDWNVNSHRSDLYGLSLKDIHVWLPYLQSRRYLIANTFEGIVHYCSKYTCSDEFMFGTLIDLIQSADFSIISVAEQAKQKLSDTQKQIFVEFIAEYFNRPNMVNRGMLSSDINDLIKKLQKKHSGPLTSAFEKSQSFELLDGSKFNAPKNSVVIKFFDTGKNVYRLEITNTSKKLVQLNFKGEEIATLFRNLRKKIFQSSEKEIYSELDYASKVLFSDLSFDGNSIDTVYYSPDFFMRNIPAALLFSKIPVLSSETAIVTLPSFSYEFLEQEINNEEYDYAFMGFGAPGFLGDESAPYDENLNENILRGLVKTQIVLETFPPLKGALEELRNSEKIMTNLGETLILSGELATKKRILNLLSGKSSKLISFATHGVPLPEISNGYYPSLLFNANQSENDDGLLSTKDILKTSIRADVIYLSTCDSASANTQGGLEWEGFVNSFLFSGAKTVVASSWKIEDQAAKTLHTFFSENLTRGLKPRFAMANALKKLRKNDNFSHPMYWGPFSVFSAVR